MIPAPPLPEPGSTEPICLIADLPLARTRFVGATGALARHQVASASRLPELRRRLADGTVAAAWACVRAAPPPDEDLPPETPIFEQDWREAPPLGFGFEEAAFYPGGRGENVTVVDIEYAWDEAHEDLAATIGAAVGGEAEQEWAFHGNGVLGVLVGGDNGFGVRGGAPSATVLVQHPTFLVDDAFEYDVAAAIVAATATLSAGDVVLVEQQVYGPDYEYLPVTWDPAARDAIRAAADAGIVVIVPSANGGVDLDSPRWKGAFDEDTGAILVGSGEPSGASNPRAWAGSDYGASVDVQAWGSGIVTTGGDSYNDLFYPDNDPRQAYTAYFGGTSGAAALVAAVAAVVESVAIATRGGPLSPEELRAVLVAAGAPQAEGEEWVGPQPDLRRVLRTWLVP